VTRRTRAALLFGADLGYALYVAVAVHNAALCSWICR
jgi:hypothetical protein